MGRVRTLAVPSSKVRFRSFKLAPLSREGKRALPGLNLTRNELNLHQKVDFIFLNWPNFALAHPPPETGTYNNRSKPNFPCDVFRPYNSKSRVTIVGLAMGAAFIQLAAFMLVLVRLHPMEHPSSLSKPPPSPHSL